MRAQFLANTARSTTKAGVRSVLRSAPRYASSSACFDGCVCNSTKLPGDETMVFDNIVQARAQAIVVIIGPLSCRSLRPINKRADRHCTATRYVSDLLSGPLSAVLAVRLLLCFPDFIKCLQLSLLCTLTLSTDLTLSTLPFITITMRCTPVSTKFHGTLPCAMGRQCLEVQSLCL